ncbi:M20 family metallo-hydrolase [Malonomonas rubra]|uniref:M20 family metallo-hydrolase n=1 Tax=Malonomonas rubra TaxID=57040 RepID=UPI0026EB5992|nr:M20 family metallo-hydrolase [Malonomonas rubra]
MYFCCRRDRLEKDFAELAQFGSLENGGFTRVAYSLEDLAARGWLQEKMEDAGLQVVVDAVGNIRGQRPGQEDLPPVMLGSHLDTVPEGGNYDGSVGILAALEIIRVLNDREQVTKRPIEVVNFSAEESSRFGVATIGSKALTGKLDLKTLKSLTDSDGFTLYDTLRESGYHPENIQYSSLSRENVHAFLELHIEQGPVLEEKECPIGLVSSIAAPTRFNVVISGRSDHSGNTPMAMRKDALVGASELVLGVENIATEAAGKDTVATVGYLKVSPGVMNVVPGRVELGIDIRDISCSDKNKAVKAVTELMTQIAAKRGLDISWKKLCDDTPVELSKRIMTSLETVAKQNNMSFIKMPSGAGHDAMNMASITDVGMIFVPSVGGVSHNIKEYSRMEDICIGAKLLLDATVRLAEE